MIDGPGAWGQGPGARGQKIWPWVRAEGRGQGPRAKGQGARAKGRVDEMFENQDIDCSVEIVHGIFLLDWVRDGNRDRDRDRDGD